MELKTLISASVQASEGDVLRFFQTFAREDDKLTLTRPSQFVVTPLTTHAVPFCEITNAQVIFIQTDKPIHVTVTFAPTAPTPPPTPATQTFLVDQVLLLTTEISDLTIANPNSGTSPDQDANVSLIIVGT